MERSQEGDAGDDSAAKTSSSPNWRSESGAGGWAGAAAAIGFGSGAGSPDTGKERPPFSRKPVPLTALPPRRPAAAAFGAGSSTAFSPATAGQTAAPSSFVSNMPSAGLASSHKRQTSAGSKPSPPQRYPSQSQAHSPYQNKGPYTGTPTIEQLERQDWRRLDDDYDSGQAAGPAYSNAYFAVPDAETPKDKHNDTPRFDDNFTEQSPKPFFGQAPQYARLGQHDRNDSNSHLLSPQFQLQHVNTPPPYGYADPHEHRLPFWHKEWLLYLLFFLGIVGAIGHHFFYQSLHGEEAIDQRKMLRYGSVLSFVVKACLSSVAILAFRQRVWVTVRRKMLSLEAVDALFAATEDLSSMANTEIVSKAKMAMLLAVFIWATPLIVILTSETLSVELKTFEVYDKCPGVRTLNFSHEETQDWRKGIKVNNQFLLSTSLWNTTSSDITFESQWYPNQTAFDYYTERSTQFEQVGVFSLYSGQALYRPNASNEICGMGWNCSYDLNFVGPGYKCSQVADGVDSSVSKLNGVETPLDFESLLPTGYFSYAVHAFKGDYEIPQIYNVTDDPVQTGGIPPERLREANGDWPRRLGAFRTEPVIWAGYVEPKERTEALPDRDDDKFDDFFNPKMIACEHYFTEYNVTISYNSTVQTHNITGRKYLRRVVDTDYVDDDTHDDYINDNTTATPEENYVYPVDLYNYRHVAAYHSMGGLFREFINNTISFEKSPSIVVEGKSASTRLIDRQNYFVVENFEEELPKVYEEMVLSLLFNPFFLAVSWAEEPSTNAGDLPGTEEKLLHDCQRSRANNVFQYHTANLWAVYGVAILLTVGAVTFGQLAVSENDGVVRDTKFSSIVAATRGPHLDGVDWALKDGQVPHRVKRIRVGYGVVTEAQMTGLGIQGPGYGFDRRRTFSPRGPDSPAPWTVPIFGFGVDGGVRQHRRPRSFTFRTPTLGRLGTFGRSGS